MDVASNPATAGLGAIYWLDAASKDEWARGFDALRELGASFAILSDWFDVAEVFREEPDYVCAALDACARSGLRAYLHIFPAAQMLEPYPIHILGDWRFNGGWSAYRRSHERYAGGPTFRFVDAFGYTLPLYNLFSRRWQQEWWLPYLETVIGRYGDHPAVVGFELSDLLLLPMMRPDVAALVSYSDEDVRRFGEWQEAHGRAVSDRPPVLPGRWSEEWTDWMAARREWLVDWAKETVAFVRQRSPGKSVVAHDEAQYLVWSAPLCGGYTPELVRAFDAFVVHHYITPAEVQAGRAKALISNDLATAATLTAGSPGWRLQCHARCRDSFPELPALREVLAVLHDSGVRRVEIDCYRRPRVPGHIFDHGQTLHEHPEAVAALRERGREQS